MRMPCRHVMSKALWMSRNTSTRYSLLANVSEMQCSRFIKWSTVLRYFRKPHCWSLNKPFDSKTKSSLLLTIRSITLQRHSVSAIERNELGLVMLQVDLGIGMTWAKCHAHGNCWEVQIWLNKVNNFEREVGLKFCTMLYVIWEGPGLEPLQDFKAKRSSFIVNSELYSEFTSSVAKSSAVCSAVVFIAG